MAHIEKYKAPSVGHMLAHYTRERGTAEKRDNIDQSRTYLNYTLGAYINENGGPVVGPVAMKATWNTVQERIESVQEATGRKVRKDAVVMADMVVTAPQNVPERDLDLFFSWTYIYIAEKVGHENMMGGYVHMDETTPHMHVPFTPIKDGRFNYKGLCPRTFYQNFHKGLGDYLEQKMGYRPEVELGQGRKKEKLLSSVPQAKLTEARRALVEPLESERDRLLTQNAELRERVEQETRRLECVRRAADHLEQVEESIDEHERTPDDRSAGALDRAAAAMRALLMFLVGEARAVFGIEKEKERRLSDAAACLEVELRRTERNSVRMLDGSRRSLGAR